MATQEIEILSDLEALTDGELNAVVGKANALLDERDKKRKKEALERARAIMAEAGLPFPVDGVKPKGKRKSASGGA